MVDDSLNFELDSIRGKRLTGVVETFDREESSSVSVSKSSKKSLRLTENDEEEKRKDSSALNPSIMEGAPKIEIEKPLPFAAFAKTGKMKKLEDIEETEEPKVPTPAINQEKN